MRARLRLGLGERPWGVVDTVVFAIVLLLGLLQLPSPFDGDQALYTLMGQAISNGAAIYRDFWDIKQPGWPLWFMTAGGMFGFTEVGIHFAELLHWMLVAVVLRLTTWRMFDAPLLSVLPPLVIVGTYYAVASPWELTQLEPMSALPLFLSYWWTLRGEDGSLPTRAHLVAAGVAAGLVLISKTVLAPVVAAIWLANLIPALKRRPDWLGAGLRSAADLLLGLAIPVGMTVAYLAWTGVLGFAVWTTFVYPLQLASFAERTGHSELVYGWALSSFGALFLLGVIGLAAWIRTPDRYLPGLFAWVIAGAFMISLQLWWPYHTVLLLLPVGLFAIRGLDSNVVRSPDSERPSPADRRLGRGPGSRRTGRDAVGTAHGSAGPPPIGADGEVARALPGSGIGQVQNHHA